MLAEHGLLFWLEPMFGKFLLPTLGSTPQVWIASMLLFQVVLFAGSYAWPRAQRSARRQVFIHVALVAIASVAVPGDARPPELPVFWQLGLMALTIGLPFFALASSARLVPALAVALRQPLFLSRASNAGSIAGLIAYPILIEPLLALDAQGKWWSRRLRVLVVLMATCAAFVLRAGDEIEPPPTTLSKEPLTWQRRARW